MKIQPSTAIEKGLTAQLMNSVTPMPRACALTWPRAPKSIFSSMGTIITQISRPTGRFTRASSSAAMRWNSAGAIWPRAMPVTMHKATQTLR